MRVYWFDLFRTLVGWPVHDAVPPYEPVLVDLGVPQASIYPKVRDVIMTGRFLTYEAKVSALFQVLGLRPEEHVAAIGRASRLWQEWTLRAEWFPCSRELVGALRAKKHPVGLITNITQPDYWALDRSLGLRRRFSFVIASCEIEQSKPHPEPHVRAEQKTPDHRPRELVMVGDSLDDFIVPRSRRWGTTIQVKPDGSDIPGLFERLCRSRSSGMRNE